ncbi:MAG: hypothetical protein WCK37_00850 [Candidatus Falkowbacteria bacterium]
MDKYDRKRFKDNSKKILDEAEDDLPPIINYQDKYMYNLMRKNEQIHIVQPIKVVADILLKHGPWRVS